MTPSRATLNIDLLSFEPRNLWQESLVGALIMYTQITFQTDIFFWSVCVTFASDTNGFIGKAQLGLEWEWMIVHVQAGISYLGDIFKRLSSVQITFKSKVTKVDTVSDKCSI